MHELRIVRNIKKLSNFTQAHFFMMISFVELQRNRQQRLWPLLLL